MSQLVLTILTLLGCVNLEKVFDPKFGYDFLKYYGYIKYDDNNENSIQSPEDGIKKFQKFFNLKIDGTFNDETIKLMSKPRCGVADITIKDNDEDDKNFTLGNDEVMINHFDVRWRKTLLTWDLKETYGNEVDIKKIIKVTEMAFKWWENISVLKFTRDSNNPDIQILLSHITGLQGNHVYDFYSKNYCQYPFNQSIVLAHAFFPYYNSSRPLHVRLDHLKNWDIDKTYFDKYNYSNYKNVYFDIITHEIGHILGIEQNANIKSIMYPYAGNDNSYIYDGLEKGVLKYFYGKFYKNQDVDYQIMNRKNTIFLKIKSNSKQNITINIKIDIEKKPDIKTEIENKPKKNKQKIWL